VEHVGGHVLGLGDRAQPEVAIPVDGVEMPLVERGEGAPIPCSGRPGEAVLVVIT
jgi:hypothetical protein